MLKRSLSLLLVLVLALSMCAGAVAEDAGEELIFATEIEGETLTDAPEDSGWDEGLDEEPEPSQEPDGTTDSIQTGEGEETDAPVLMMAVAPAASLAIARQPADVEGVPGDVVQFSVVASGASGYRWQNSKDGVTWNDTRFDGCNTSTLNVTVRDIHYNYMWRCVVTGTNGATVNSNSARIVAPAVMTITSQPQDVTAVAGDTAVFSVKASGATGYCWQNSKDGVTWSNTRFSGCATDTLSVTVSEYHYNYRWRCVLTDANGNTLYTNSAYILAPVVLTIARQPQDVTAKPGATAVFSVEATGAAGYRWQNSKDGVTWNNTRFAGFDTDTLSVSVAEYHYNYIWRCVLTDADGNAHYTDSVSILAPVELTITRQPQDVEAVPGDTAVFTVKAEDAASYRWQNSKDGVTWSDTRFSGYNTDTITMSVIEGRYNYIWRCAIVDGYGDTIYSDSARIIKPVQGKILSDPENVEAIVGETISFSIEAEGAVRYFWQNSKDGVTWNNSGLMGYNTDTITMGVIQGRYNYLWRCGIVDAYGNTYYSDIAWIIEPEHAEIIAQPEHVMAFTGDTVEFSVEATGATSYLWERSSDGENWYIVEVYGYDTSCMRLSVDKYAYDYFWRCGVEDAYGDVTYSDLVWVIEPVRGSIMEDPQDVEALVGETVSFGVVAYGANSYRWQNSKDGITWNNTGVSGYNTDTITMTVTEARYDYIWRCAITDDYGDTIYSGAACIIEPAHGMIIQDPVSVEAFIGETISFSVEAEGVVSYCWQNSKDGVTWKNTGVSGYNTDTITMTVTEARYDYIWRCVIVDAHGDTLYSDAAWIIQPALDEPYLEAEADDNAIIIRCGTVNNAEEYILHRSSDGGNEYQVLGNFEIDAYGDPLQYIDYNLTKGKTYYYFVEVIDEDGLYEGCISESVSETAQALYVQIDVDTLELKHGETAQLTAEYSFYGPEPTHTWTSSNKSVATVDNYGNIVAEGPGTAVITVNVHYNGNVSAATCTVTVTQSTLEAPVLSAYSDSDAIWLSAEAVENCDRFEVYRSESRNGTYSYIADVYYSVNMQDTTVKQNKTYYYKVYAYDSSGVYKGAWSNIASAAMEGPGITLYLLDSSLKVGESTEALFDCEPLWGEEANMSVSWSSSNNNVATVDADGIVQAKQAGTADITVALSCDRFTVYGSTEVTVTGQYLDSPEIVEWMVEDDSICIAWTEPANAEYCTLYRATEVNGTYVKLGSFSCESGFYDYYDTGVVGGENYFYKVYAHDSNGIYSTSCSYIVSTYFPVPEIILGNTAIELVAGGKHEIYADLYLMSGEIPNYTWTSSNTSVATVAKNADGYAVVTAKGAGTATITCSYSCSRYTTSATCTVRVISKAPTLATPWVEAYASEGTIHLSWDNVDGAQGYYLMRSEDGGSYTRIKTIAADDNLYVEYDDTGLDWSVTYSYKVQAYKSNGSVTSSYSIPCELRPERPIVSEEGELAFNELKDGEVHTHSRSSGNLVVSWDCPRATNYSVRAILTNTKPSSASSTVVKVLKEGYSDGEFILAQEQMTAGYMKIAVTALQWDTEKLDYKTLETKWIGFELVP